MVKKRSIMSASIKQIHIELTNQCNLNCIMCYRQEMATTISTMDYDMFIKIADQIATISTIEKVFLHWRGEPTCCEYLFDAVKYLCSYGLKVILFTNGVTLNAPLVEKLISVNIYAIYFSVESFNSAGYKLIRGRNKYNIVKKNLTEAIHIRNKLGSQTKINISAVIVNQDFSWAYTFNKYWGNVVDAIEYHVDSRSSQFLRSQQEVCNWPNIGVFISWNGVVAACCMDVNIIYPIGDINNSKILDIFNSKSVKTLRSSLASGNAIGKCSSCALFSNKVKSESYQ